MSATPILKLARKAAPATWARRAKRRDQPEDARRRPKRAIGGAARRVISEEQCLRSDAREEFVLSVTEKGFGVRSSAYDYRITGRGGQGIDNMRPARATAP